MRGTSVPATSDLAASRVKLLDELRFTPQRHGEQIFYHVEVPSRSQFFRVGYAEYVLLSLLDGHTTLAQAQTLMVRALGADALSQPRAVQIYTWAIEQKLVRILDEPATNTTANASRPTTAWQLFARCNPLWIRVPLFRPDRLLTALAPALGWLAATWMMVLSLLLMLAALAVIGSHWERFCHSATSIFARDNWLWLGAAWVLLKLCHELAHGVVAKRYRGEVREFGIVFAFFAPTAYVDVTSCWRFSSKWQRIHVAAAGMWCELSLASLAAFAWAGTTSAVWTHFWYDIVLMASVSTFLFNANPLMKLDGYFMLSDFLEIPNLAQAGQQRINDVLRWLFFGVNSSQPRELGNRGRLVLLYGAAAGLWRMMVSATLLVSAAALGQGAGWLLVAVALAAWYGETIARTLATVRQTYREMPTAFFRAATVATAFGLMLASGWCWLPWPGAVAMPGIIDYQDSATVRSRTNGFVHAVHVRDGQQVTAGELLLELTNDELQNELRSLELERKISSVRRRVAQDRHLAGELQIADRNQQALDERIAELQRRCAALRIYAPTSGRVVARNLEQRLATFVKEGDELLTIGDESQKELIVSVAQEQLALVRSRLGESVPFRIGTRPCDQGTLARLEPRATHQLPHAALGANVAGPLPVVTETTAAGHGESRLTEARFRLVVSLPANVSVASRCGEQAHALFGLSQHRFGEKLWWLCSRWVRDQWKSLQSGA